MATESDKSVVIIGGHGKIALQLAHLLEPTHAVTSVIRDSHQSADIDLAGAKPFVLSLEDDSVEKFAELFEGYDVVYFCAGAGGKGGEERTKKVDYEGALKVFDALDMMEGPKPFLVYISAIDVRDTSKPPPAHYDENDIAKSKKAWESLATYYKYKYEADKSLVTRTKFKWCIVRPGTLSDEPATGKVEVGRTHLGEHVSRGDVAKMLALLVDRVDAAGLALDLVGGKSDLEEALDKAIKKGESDFLG